MTKEVLDSAIARIKNKCTIFNPIKLRNLRNFEVAKYYNYKINAINDFFKEESLDSAVVRISGGIDSAIVYNLLIQASLIDNSPIKKIVALIMPIFCPGTTNQNESLIKGKLIVSQHSKSESYILDLSEALQQHLLIVQKQGLFPTKFSIGQLASYIRTPQLYFQVAIMKQKGLNPIVVGSTNRDEGSYIGYYGKTSDGAVDLQPIADIHKSEVYQLAELLKIPQEIIDSKPSSDVWDGKSDEERIGVPFWFLELYILMKDYPDIIPNFDEEQNNKNAMNKILLIL